MPEIKAAPGLVINNLKYIFGETLGGKPNDPYYMKINGVTIIMVKEKE